MGSLFDGIGGFILAGTFSKIDTLWSSEIDPCCEAVTKYHFPYVKQLGDITKINGALVKPVDIICGGSPCQDLSIAGKRAGLAGERSGLYMEQIRIIREMRAATNNTYPRYMVWENVPGALSSNKGEDFNAVLEEAAKCAEVGISIPEPKRKNGKIKWGNAGNIVGNGWSIAWRILDAQYWGVPQRRRRIFLVADFGSECAGEILFEQEGVRRDSAESRTQGQGIAGNVEGSVRGSGKPVCILNYQGSKGNSIAEYSDKMYTLNAMHGHDVHCVVTDGNMFNESGKGYWMSGCGCLRAEGENRPSRPGHIVCLNPHVEQEGLRGHSAESGEEGKRTSDDVKGSLDGSVFNESGQGYWMPDFGCLRAEGENRPSRPGHIVCLNQHDSQSQRIYDARGIYPAVSANENGGQNRQAILYEPKSAFEENWAASSVKNAIRADASKSSHAVVESAGFNGWKSVTGTIQYAEERCPTIEANMPPNVLCVDCRNHTINEVSATIQAKENGGQSLNYINPVCYSITGYSKYVQQNPTLRSSGGDAGGGSETLICDKRIDQSVFTMQRNDEFSECGIASTQSARQYKSATDIVVTKECQRRYIIRRLTPVECERLQGYPDGWTIITYKNKQLSDSARYRMLGNSVAIPCVVRVLSGISGIL
jgi:DNA (cytosine-5)-methyltransferase 1